MKGTGMQVFVRLTGWLPQWLCFRTKILYEDRKQQGRLIHGPAIVVSNHTAVYDYAVMLFVFFSRTLRYQMAEVLFRKKLLGLFLRQMGGIYLDRESRNLSFLGESETILKKGGVVGIFPEGRLPLPGEKPPNAFRPGAAYLSLSTGVPVIPVYTDGSYFRKKRAHVVIGTPMHPADYAADGGNSKESITRYAEAMRQKIMMLKELTDGSFISGV